ncbi:hypothetical protein [Kitasatospora sp. NPDC015120]|uniref:hypothetical protein n=1 Tax=Kitasatospora sp. NPDC015120 TaxID=3364023 RepID=UPI0036F49F6B
MARRLAFAVHLEDPATGDRLVLLPDEIPARELAELITHPGAWHPDDDPADDGPGDGDGPAGSAGATLPTGQADADDASASTEEQPAAKAARTRKTRTD